MSGGSQKIWWLGCWCLILIRAIIIVTVAAHFGGTLCLWCISKTKDNIFNEAKNAGVHRRTLFPQNVC